MLLVSLLIGCGTIMYPKRVGQKGGNLIDAGVAVMDGLCLLLFIVPGVVAFIVDFSNGAIYLPSGGYGSLDIKDMKKIDFDAKKCTIKDIENIVKIETGYDVKTDRPGVRMYAFSSYNELKMQSAVCLQDKEFVVSRR
jgi:hypothetical protein